MSGSPYFNSGPDPFGRGATSKGGSDPFGRTGNGSAKKSGGNIFGHLVGDVKDTLANIVPGAVRAVEHPIGTAKDVAKSYEQTYGPLFEGHVGKFLHGVEQHPLGPILDLASVVTLGGTGAAHAAELLAKAGVVADGSKLAELSKAVDLTAPDFAKVAGQDGTDVLIKRSSRNPVIRARQKAINDLLNKLPSGTPVLGSTARVLKAMTKGPERARAALIAEAEPFRQSFEKLTPEERAAWHLAARAVHPLEYAQHLEQQTHPVSTATMNILRDPKVSQLVVAPSKNLEDALTKGAALSQTLGELKIRAGHISELSAAEAPYRLLRIVRGAKFVPHDAAEPSQALKVARDERDRLAEMHAKALHDEAAWMASQREAIKEAGGRTGGPSVDLGNPHRERIVSFGHALDVAQQRVDKLTKPAVETGWVGGPAPADLARELQHLGRPQPFYVPDSAELRRHGGKFSRRPTGLAEPAASGASKTNMGVLANRGLLAMHENPLYREFVKFGNHTEASLLHDEIVKHAAELPKGVALPPGFEYLKLNRGETAAPYVERTAAKFDHALEPGTADKVLTRDENAPDLATSKAGHRLVVPEDVRQILENQSLTHRGALHRLLYSHPTSVWKHLVLGLRPAFFANITVGNSILGALQMAPGRHGIAAWLNQVTPGAEKVLGSKLSKQTFADTFPEQAIGSFGHSAGFTSNKGLSVAQKAYQGVMPATIAYENVLRRAMAEGWAKATPEVRREMKQHGGDVNAALRAVADSHPHVINEISKRIDDALGNYRRYNNFETQLKQVLPFYGWDRHIVRSTGRLVSERPAAVDAVTKLGAVGQQQEQKTLGDLPSYMQGSIRVGDLAGLLRGDGRTNVLSTRSLDPFTTVGELATIPEALTGKAGVGSEVLSSGLNPIIQALIEQATGRSLLSGAPIAGNAFANAAANIPQAALIASALGRGKKSKPTSLYQNDARTRLAALLGVPIKKVALNTAHLYATEAK